MSDARLRSLTEADADRLTAILQQPGVARWWPGYDRARVQEELVEAGDKTVWGIEAAGELVGAIQAWEENDEEFRHAGIDLFLDDARQGAGIGPAAIGMVVDTLRERGHHRLTIDPAAANHRAVRAYEKAGFRRVGVLRRYQRMPDGSWADGLLMELVIE